MEQIEYTRTVVPSSMRSPYWKYFGFPSDSSNNILTRRKIVCTVCNTMIAYNKNTSNLRTHLMSKHVEIFKKIVPSSNVSMVQSEIAIDEDGEHQSNKRQCVKIFDSGYELAPPSQNDNISPTNCLTLPEYESVRSKTNTNLSTFAANKINCEIQSTDFTTYFPSNDIVPSEETLKDEYTAYAINEKAETYFDVDLHQEHKQQLHSMDIMLADYIQTDLLPLDTLKEFGFCKYNQQLTGLKVDDDTVIRVKRIIDTRYMNIKQTVNSHITRLSQSKPYSLSFEIYKDYEEQDVLNIYFNYLNEKQVDLISILYTSCVICSKDVNITELINGINLSNCGGVVVSSTDEFQFVSDFANVHELPLIECLESLLLRCLKKIFEKTEFYAEYQKFLRTILEKNDVISVAKFNLKTKCQWKPLIMLEYIFSNVEKEKIGKWNELREFFEYLKPLKMAMDIIMDEPLPLCSLTRPLIKKLFEEHFISTNQQVTKISQIQKILEKELYERIFSKAFLREVTFFDIRFHRDLTLQGATNDIAYLKAEIIRRYENILQVAKLDVTNNAVIEQNSTDSFNIRKCSSLKSFFKRGISLANADFSSDLKTNLDLEFEKYYNQACLDLDKSPILWWEQQTDNYKQLSKIAKYYLTIPCCCIPRLCRIDIDKRYSKLERRSNLSQFCNTESKLWYLYYNEDVTQFL